MVGTDSNKQVVRQFIDVVWMGGNLGALGRFWTAECVNHAAAAGRDVGLAALRSYHESFAAQLAAFSDVTISVVQQVADHDRVVTHLLTRARHTAEFAGIPATGRTVALVTIRIDRLEGDLIAEHWSVADLAGVVSQLQG